MREGERCVCVKEIVCVKEGACVCVCACARARAVVCVHLRSHVPARMRMRFFCTLHFPVI
jgi:hypothetical protein